MPTVEAIRKVTIQASTPGVDRSTSALNDMAAAQNRVALSANQLQVSMASAQKLIDDNVQKLQALKSANDNVGSSYADLIGKARDVSGSFSETVENILNTINHLKLLAVAAYAMSPALRSIVNADVAKALGLIPPVALAAGKSFLSFAAPALSFFGRIALPIGGAVLAWKGFNAIIDQGSALLQKYGGYERTLFSSGTDASLTKLTKFQGDDGTSLVQQQYATELATRLAAAKQEISDMVGIQFNLTDAALRFQAIWVSIAEAMGRAASWINSVNITMADIGNSAGAKLLLSVGHALGNWQLPGTLQIAPPGAVVPDTAAAQALSIARGRLASGMDIAASNEAKTGKYQFRTFPGMFSDDIDALANPQTPDKAKAPNDYDRQIESIKNQITQLNLEADGASKTSTAIQELKTAHDLNDAAMKANIPVTQQMLDQWKAYADTIAGLNLQIKEQKALQDEQFKGATMFMSPTDAAAAGVAHGIDPNNWQAHLNDPAAQTAKLNEELKQSSQLATGFADSFTQGMLSGRTATQSLMSALQGLESKLLSLAENQLIDSLFGGSKPGAPGFGGGLVSLFTLLGAAGPSPQLAMQNAAATGAPATDVAYAFHTGGIVGSGGAARYVHPGYFDAAPRFHAGGLAGDEVPIIAQRGEGVFTPAQMAAMGGGSNVNVVVNNTHSGASVGVQQQKRPDGGVDLVMTVKDIVNSHLASGGADNVFKSRYGMPIRPRSR